MTRWPLTERHVDRCPLCGAWRWRTTCRTPHEKAAAA